MKIVNKTGNSKDTRIYDDVGKDITGELMLTKIVIEAGTLNRVTLTCVGVELDMVGDLKS